MTTRTEFLDSEFTWEQWQAMKCLNSGVLFISKSLHITIYNGLAAQLLGVVTPIGEPVHISECLSPDREEYQTLAYMMNSGTAYRNQVVTWAVDGSIRHVLMDSYHSNGDRGGKAGHGGKNQGMHVVMKDLGNLAVIDQQMQKNDKLATVGKIAAGIAHEIRNPLTTIKGFLQMMEHRFAQTEMSPELQYTRVMLGEINRVNGLVSELLLLSKPHKVEKTSCSVQTIMDELNPLIESEALLRGVDYLCTVGEVGTITADPRMIKQVVLNLSKNALEAMEQGGRLRLNAYRADRFVQIDVSDTGPGIPYYLIDKIFDAFYTSKEKGTGLGLPICQRIVSEHGGEIRVSSKGFGTTFSVLLPMDAVQLKGVAH